MFDFLRSIMKDRSIIAVVVGLLWNEEKKILFCQRPDHKSYPLKWEFPGGKVKAGESSIEALRRELEEELGIISTNESFFYIETTSYSDGRTYRVEYFDVTDWQGALDNREFAQITWVDPTRFDKFDILEGNTTICAMLATSI